VSAMSLQTGPGHADLWPASLIFGDEADFRRWCGLVYAMARKRYTLSRLHAIDYRSNFAGDRCTTD